MAPINITLYAALKKKFKQVSIANEGEIFQAKLIPSPFGLEKQLEILEAGEYYRVNCPFCGDTRQRLWINHRWATRYGNKLLKHVAVCYNENCEQTVDMFYHELLDMIYGNKIPEIDLVMPAIVKETTIPTLDELGTYTFVDQLPADHAIRLYLQSRNFDADELGKVWKVAYYSSSLLLPSNNRIYFPVFNEAGEHIGGQARWYDVQTRNDKPPYKHIPKYYTLHGFKKSKHLYNIENIKPETAMVIVGEGPFDAIRAGRNCGVAAFGKDISATQRQLLWDKMGRHGGMIIMALDPDADDDQSTQNFSEWCKGWEYFIKLDISDYKDIGEMPQKIIFQRIWKQLKEHQWRKENNHV